MCLCRWTTAAAFLISTATRLDAQQTASRLSLDSLLGTQIQAASKYLQTSSEAPASVTIITADDIAQHRYRNLLEVLESVRGFYVSNDRTLPYLGMRGFSRPTDYNNRILLLIDGHSLNDQTWGATPVGGDLPINLDVVERIEIVRGPGSALYGTNAMFAVINIVTKTGVQLNGLRASGSFGTGNSREAAIAAGTALGARGSVAASAIVTRADGGTLRYPELADQPGGGISRNQDWEESAGALASAKLGALATQFGYRSRSKGIPTGAFGTTLGDARAMTKDETLWGEVSARRETGGIFGVGVRLYADRYNYRGVYPTAPGPSYNDGGGSTSFGSEVVATWDPVSRDRVTFGAEYRRVTRANYFETQSTGEQTSDDSPFSLGSIFAENALHLSSSVDLITGIRYERNRNRDAVAPRFAMLFAPNPLTTVKVLYGQAYRTPSAAEADITTTFYTRNPGLRPERIATTEIEIQRHVVEPLLVTASAFHYRVRNLIDQVSIDTGGVEFRNRAEATAVGIELQADVIPEGPVSAHATYSAQRTRSDDSEQSLTNAPTHIANVSVSAGSGAGLRGSAAVRYESKRLTLQGTSTDAFVRTDITVGYSPAPAGSPSWRRGLGVSLRVTNLFNANYSVPGGLEHMQSSIPQPGRVLTLRVDWSR